MTQNGERSLFHRLLLCFYSLLFRLFVRSKYKKSYSVMTRDFIETIAITDEEWERECAQEQTEETHIISASTPDGASSLFLSLTTSRAAVSAFVQLTRDGETWEATTVARPDFSDLQTIVAGPLRLEMREPFRRWRVHFKGTMRNTSTDSSAFVTIGGWWKPTSDARHFFANADVDAIESAIVARPLAIGEHLREMKRLLLLEDIAQWGELHAQISISGETHDAHMRGLRTRILGADDEQQTLFSCYFEDGNRVVWQQRESPSDGGATVSHAFLSRSSQYVIAARLKNPRAVIEIASGQGDIIDFETCVPLSLTKAGAPSSSYFSLPCGTRVQLTRVPLRFMDKAGVAFLVETSRARDGKEQKQKLPVFDQVPNHTATESERLLRVVPFSHRACQDASLTGGKGANLAKLTAIAQGFIVPRGVVVTVAAFEAHLAANPALSAKIARLAEPGSSLERIVQLGEEIGADIVAAEITAELRAEITASLELELGANARVAVRSSAVGEDGAELSSAGQLESYMDVSLDQVPEKLQLCWASNFRREVLSYRRQYGQVLNPPVAVVVQRMIDNAIAGVLFTCDPVRGDPSLLVVNAHAGRGEDVVSGQVTPDHIIIRKSDAKTLSEPSPCCLSADSQLQLSTVGCFLERVFGRPQDVEFVVAPALATSQSLTVHVVQSRDVTGRERESDFELKTEFVTAHLTDREIISTCNVGEVLNLPQWPLSRSLIFPIYEKPVTGLTSCDMDGEVLLMAIMMGELPAKMSRHYHIAMCSYNNRFFFNMGECLLRRWRLIEQDRVAEYALAGQKLFDDEMFAMAKERYDDTNPLFVVARLFNMLYILWHSSYTYIAQAHAHSALVRVYNGGSSTAELMCNIRRQQKALALVIDDHANESAMPTFAYVIVAIVARGSQSGEFTKEIQSDISLVFSNGSGAISGDVPQSLKKLALSLRSEGLTAAQLTAAATPEEGIRLIEAMPKSAALLAAFLERHGHRGPMELDLRGESWRERPQLLLHTLASMLSSAETSTDVDGALAADDAPPQDMDAILDSLHNRPQGIKRKLMRYMIAQTHRGVAGREECKDLLARASFHLRENVRTLGERMEREGLLPDAQLVFFFTMEELEQYVQDRSPRLIARSMRRRKFFPAFEGHDYPYVLFGAPKEIGEPSPELRLETQLSGTTVCEGRVVARARVAKTLDDAKETQPGEILITRCTDICWSPFFPLIKGIVTEIGGLLSHGAVVAREYGLPSMIAVQHATDVFQTGDLVELNATKSVISKVSVEDK